MYMYLLTRIVPMSISTGNCITYAVHAMFVRLCRLLTLLYLQKYSLDLRYNDGKATCAHNIYFRLNVHMYMYLIAKTRHYVHVMYADDCNLDKYIIFHADRSDLNIQ